VKQKVYLARENSPDLSGGEVNRNKRATGRTKDQGDAEALEEGDSSAPE
jgi:hypothetical protein